MTYIALARRLRPQTLKQVIGQKLTVQALSNALNQNTVHPVYLFTGTRGIGKTTLARIIAKSLNCENGQDADPCLKCDTCTMIQQGNYPDLYEIDAASKTKVEDTREVLDHIQYLPQTGRKKVYLIDEVHMLSQHSFNALLKTLEEPPEHVQFILATTEPNKIPKTILSRCLHFNLQPLSVEEIQQYLSTVLTTDKIDFEPEALEQIAQAADGSMRDALSLLDQCLAISPTGLNRNTTQSLLSTIPQAKLVGLMHAIHAKDVTNIDAMCQQFEKNNIDFKRLLQQIAALLLEINLDQLSDHSPSNELSSLWPSQYIQVLYRMLMQGISDLDYSPTPRIGTCMCLIRMAVFYPKSSPTHIGKTNTPQSQTPQPQKSHNPDKPWEELLKELPIGGMLKELLDHTVVKKDNQHWHFTLNPSVKHLLTAQSKQKTQDALNQYLPNPITVSIEVGSSTEQSPAENRAEDHQIKTKTATKHMQNDPVLQSLMKEMKSDLEQAEISPVGD